MKLTGLTLDSSLRLFSLWLFSTVFVAGAAGAAYGATRTAAVSGEWTSGSTWEGGIAPANGDSIVIPSGLTVSVVSGHTVSAGDGTAPSAIVIQGDGRLTIGAGATVVTKGNVTVQGSVTRGPKLELLGGALEFDPAAGQALGLVLGTAYHVDASLLMRPANGTRPAVRKRMGAPGTVNIQMPDVAFVYAEGVIDAEDADFERLGSDAVDAIKIDSSSATAGISLTRTRMRESGTIRHYSRTGGISKFIDTSVTASAGSDALFVLSTSTTDTASTVLLRSEFDGAVSLAGKMESAVVEDNLFHRMVNGFGGMTPLASWKGNFFYQVAKYYTSGTYNGLAGVHEDSYALADYTDAPGTGNPHFYTHTYGNGPLTLRRMVFEYRGDLATDTGDVVDTGSDDVTIENIVVLKSSWGAPHSSGAMWEFSGGNGRLSLRHSTVYLAGTASGVKFPHSTDPGMAGKIPEIRSNIFWADQPGTSAIDCDSPATAAEDYVLPGGISHNVGFGLGSFANTVAGAPQQLYGILRTRLSSKPEAFQQLDPQFRDPNRRFIAWGREVRGLAGTDDQVRDAALAAISANPTLTRTSLVPWVMAGFQPRNTALRNAAHDGADIGAMPVYEEGPLATTYSVSAPTEAVAGKVTSDIVVKPSGVFTGTITLSVQGVPGTWAPQAHTWTTSSEAKVFTFTPSASGKAVLSFSNDGHLTNPSSQTIDVKAAVAAPTNLRAVGN